MISLEQGICLELVASLLVWYLGGCQRYGKVLEFV